MSLLPETDSEDEMPVGWEERVDLNNKVYFVNHLNKTTQWFHPKSGKRMQVFNELPYGWERTIDADGHILFVDKINNKSSRTDPRLAFAFVVKDYPNDIKQRFDSSATAMAVLNGLDLSNKVCVITGANTGIGYECARSLALHGAHVIIACKDLIKTQEAIERIKQERPQAKLDAMKCDLSSFKSVRAFAEQFKALSLPLHILICNAAVFALPYTLTEDGLEMIFQVNYLAHFYLIKLLRDEIILSSPSRIVLVSSESHRFHTLTESNCTLESFKASSSYFYLPMIAYNNSKLYMLLMMKSLTTRLQNYNVTINSCHPGNMICTSLSRNWWFYRLMFFLGRPITKTVEQGAATPVFCATAKELEGVTGFYFNNSIRCSTASIVDNEVVCEKLWKISEQLIDEIVKDK